MSLEKSIKDIQESLETVKDLTDTVSDFWEVIDETVEKVDSVSSKVDSIGWKQELHEKSLNTKVERINKRQDIVEKKVEVLSEVVDDFQWDLDLINERITVYNDQPIYEKLAEQRRTLKQASIEIRELDKQKADKQHKHVIDDIEWLPALLEDIKSRPTWPVSVGGYTKWVRGVVAWPNVTIDNTDPRFPIISWWGSWIVETIVAWDWISVDSTDPANPIINSWRKRSWNNNYMTTGFIGRWKRPVEAIDIFWWDVDFDLTSTGSDSTTAHIRRARGTYTLDSNDDVIYTDLLPPNAGDTVQSREAEWFTKTWSATPWRQKVVQEAMSVLWVTPWTTALLMGAKYISIADATWTLKKFMEHLWTWFTNFYTFAWAKFVEFDHTLSKVTLTAKTIVAPAGGTIKALASCALHVKWDVTWSAYDPWSNNVWMFFENFWSSDAFYVFQLATWYWRVFEISNAWRAYIYGNLGIGTLSPADKLHVVWTKTGGTWSPATPWLTIHDLASAAQWVWWGINFTWNYTWTTPTTVGSIQAYKENSTAWDYWFAMTFHTRLNWSWWWAEGMRLSSTGNLWIWTLTPTARLTVVISDSTISASKSASFSLVKVVATDNHNAVYANTNTVTLWGAWGHLNAVGTMNYIVMSSASSTANVVRWTYSRVWTAGTNNATSLAMYVTHYEWDGTWVITNWYGYTVWSVWGSFAAGRFTNNAQTITNTYGIYIGDLTSWTQTNKPYWIYQDDAWIDNYLNWALWMWVLRATAWVDLVWSSVTRPSLRVRPWVAPTSPNDWDVRYDWTDLKVRIWGVTKTFVLI